MLKTMFGIDPEQVQNQIKDFAVNTDKRLKGYDDRLEAIQAAQNHTIELLDRIIAILESKPPTQFLQRGDTEHVG